MAFGMQVQNAGGNVIFDTGRFTRYVTTYTVITTSSATYDISCPGIQPNSDWVAIPYTIVTAPADDSQYAASVTLYSDLIRLTIPSWFAGTVGVTIYILVVRY